MREKSFNPFTRLHNKLDDFNWISFPIRLSWLSIVMHTFFTLRLILSILDSFGFSFSIFGRKKSFMCEHPFFQFFRLWLFEQSRTIPLPSTRKWRSWEFKKGISIFHITFPSLHTWMRERERKGRKKVTTHTRWDREKEEEEKSQEKRNLNLFSSLSFSFAEISNISLQQNVGFHELEKACFRSFIWWGYSASAYVKRQVCLHHGITENRLH